MKKTFVKMLAVLVLLAVIVTPLSTFASNQDVTINKFTLTATQKYVTGQKKDNATSCYVKVTLDGYLNCKINVYGQTQGGSALKTNCNYGSDNRIIKSATAYFVRNLVNEKGYGYASMGFTRNTTSNYTIQGVWSPDSVAQSGVITI